ncbi:MAG: type II secretion system protein [bacterium]|nr:type II secretion system protein [bacterium]
MSIFRENKGFTLIELVMVIVILGILAAVAVPKFQDMQGKAHAAAVQGIVGGVSGGVSLYQAQALVGNTVGGTALGTGLPTDLDGQAASATTNLFLFVLQQPMNADWTKSSAALTASGNVDYVYNTGATHTATCNYDNATGIFYASTDMSSW